MVSAAIGDRACFLSFVGSLFKRERQPMDSMTPRLQVIKPRTWQSVSEKQFFDSLIEVFQKIIAKI